MRLILASASERRKELLNRLTNGFEVIVSNFDEDKIEFKRNFGNYVIELAKGKANAVAELLDTGAVVIGCDTIVALEAHILGKPKDKIEAFNMLKLLSGNVHQVYSGIAVINTETKALKTYYVSTNVKFSTLTDEEIQRYIETGEPMDKAGAYGIQGFGGVFVEEIHGDYYSVVGLPINKLNYILKGMGVNL
jgi:septum formation protein